MASDSQLEIDETNKLVTPQDIQFYFRSSWYLLVLILVIEFIIMFVLSRIEWGNSNLILWINRVIVFGYIFWKISKKFRQLNLALFGALLGLETGFVVAIVKIIINKAAQWTWFNLITEPLHLLGFGAVVGFIFYSLNNKK
jgi:hypothetical protein